MHRTAVTGKKSPRSTHAPAAVHDMKTHELMAHHLTHATQNSDRLKPIRLPATQKQNHVLQLRANVKWLFWSSKHCEVSKDHHSKDPVPSQLSFLSLRGFKRNPKLYRKIKKQNWSKLTIMAISPSQSFCRARQQKLLTIRLQSLDSFRKSGLPGKSHAVCRRNAYIARK